MGAISWKTIFNPQFTHGGIDLLTRSTASRLLDDFELYTSDANLQATWSVTNGAVGDPRLTTVANALKGQQSVQVTATGGVATLFRAIPNNTFQFPAGRRIRYIAFKGIVTTGTSTIRVRLSDASDVNLFREWSFTLGTDVTRDHVIDLYSGGSGYQNTEGFPGPVAEGATAWNPTLIDRFGFYSLTSGSVYRFDDIRFFYEYSLLDAIGFGTEPVTDDGADGSVHSKLRYLNNVILQLVGTTSQYAKYGPADVRLNNSYTFGLELKGAAEQGIPSTTEITPGNYTIDRVRSGTTTNIVASTTASESAGFISVTYTPLEDNWQLGDQIVVTFSGGTIDNDTDATVTPTANIGLGATTVQLDNAALFQVGQRIRIYDDLTTEYNSVLSIDSPVQITINATANAYTSANNFRITLVERTTLQTARISSNITYQPEITAELERWVLADYDDFDFADADGNNERWDTGYIANSDGSAAGVEGGTADINTTTAGQVRVQVDPDATPTQAAYAIKRDEPTRSKYFSVMVDADVVLNADQATSTFAGLRVSAGDVDDPNNYILIAREASNAVNRITARAEFNNVAQTTANFSTTDNAVAFKIERYNNVWNIFYSLTQYPNWIWTKLTQFEDVNGDMSSSVSFYLYAESAGTVDAQTAVVDFDNWKYYIGSGSIDQILSILVLATGTFTTSSATVPADTGRLEGDNYWNGNILMPVSGVAAFQARTIVDFANAGGVFTIDGQNVFTTAPAVGDEYVILAYQYPLVPAADAATNQTSAHVVGNKTDAIPAMNLAPGNDSSIAHLKAILERVGATPADPDDSVLTNIGQRDDVATLDTLADITTTSIQAKLRRLLLRFSADAFSSTVQGVARVDIENMVQGLANYLSSAGAAWSVTANPGAAAKDNLEQTLEDFADMLAGTTGIVTFPTRAVAANGISMAEVLRHAAESIGEDTANNDFASTNVTANRDGSALERLEDLRNIASGGQTVGTFTHTAAGGTAEQTVTTINPTTRTKVYSIWLDLVNLTQNATIRVKYQIDGTNYRTFDSVNWTTGMDDGVLMEGGFVVNDSVTITIASAVAEAADRDVPFQVFTETRE